MNYASGFLKDLKSNSSINQIGNKLKKNISDLKEQGVSGQTPSWLETANLKEQLVSAAKEIQTAVNATDPPLTKTESQQIVSSNKSDPTASPQRRTISTGNFDSSPTSSSSGSFRTNNNEFNEPPMDMKRQVPSRPPSELRSEAESPQPGSINLRDAPRHREGSINLERRTSSATGRRQQPVPPTQKSSVTENQQIQKNSSNEFYQASQSSNRTEVVDALELAAMRETNEVLKSEVQRLSVLETKLKTLEKEKEFLRDSTGRMEGDLKELTALKIKCEKLEAEVKHLKLTEEKTKMFQRNNDSNMERLEVENADLKSRIYDLEKLVEETELNFSSTKIKEQSLEKQNRLLEKELDRLSEKTTSSDMQALKVEALEQANKICEKEMEEMRKELGTEKASKNVSMEKIRSLEDTIKKLQYQIEQSKNKGDENMQSLEKQCDDYRKKIGELQSLEKNSGELQRTIAKLKDELKSSQTALTDEKRLYEAEKKKNYQLSEDFDALNKTLAAARDKFDFDQDSFEIKLNTLFKNLEKKDLEVTELRKSRDAEIKAMATKLQTQTEENQKMANLLKTHGKDDELKVKIAELTAENEKLVKTCAELENLENDLIDAQFSKDNATKRVEDLESKLRKWEEKYNKEVGEFKTQSQQYLMQIKTLKQQVTDETLKAENLSTDCSLLKIESNKVDSLRLRCESLERELSEARTTKSNNNIALNEDYTESDNNKLLMSQIRNLKTDVRVREQEVKQLEKLIESERCKTQSYVKQIDELNNMQSQSCMQVSEYKRRLVSMEMLTDECNQLRKNLTQITIESEGRKSEITALMSQINILESTVKSLRETTEKRSSLELDYENVTYELKKKQEDYKRLQQLHDTVKKEQQETIELLEEKLRDTEKKTEMQILKHEEVMLELELIRTRRDRLLPLCPNCSSQISYQQQQHSTNSASQSPQPFHHSLIQPMYHQSQPVATSQSMTQSQHQALLSIQIPQQAYPQSLMNSPYHQAHLSSGLQFIQLPGISKVTVECQTSPNTDNNENELLKSETTRRKTVKKIEMSQHATQTVDIRPKLDNKEINTDRVIQRNQAIMCNICLEPVVKPLVLEDKGVQIDESQLQALKQKYFLYTCKYSYDPLKSSPNNNPEAELTLLTGDFVFILSEEDEDGFYMGESIVGKRGLVPSNFVEKVNIDQANLQKQIQSLPKNLLSNPKFKECANLSGLDAGQIILVAQQLLAKVSSQPTNTKVVATVDASTSPIITQAKPKNSLIPVNHDDDLNESKVKIGLPYPSNIKIEKRNDTSFLVSWDPPTAPISLNQSIDCEQLQHQQSTLNSESTSVADTSAFKLQSYNIYLNHEVYTMINANEERAVIVEDVDLNMPNRISIQAVASGKDMSSKPQECTLLFGSNRSFAPSGLSVYCLSQTSAIVSWWPSSSLFSHIISIDNIEHRTLKPGIYRFKLSGLQPDTSHLIVVTAQISNHTNESSSNYSASVEFRTLPSRILSVPQDLAIEKDSVETDTYNLSWKPVCDIENAVSNGIPIGGYSIYLDGVRVHQILNPTASTVNLNQKLLFGSGAKVLTVRTLSLDGNAESKDSEPLHLSKNLISQVAVPPIVHEDPQPLSQRTTAQVKPVPVTASSTTATLSPAAAPQPQPVSSNPLAALKNPLTSLFNTVNNEVAAFNESTKKGTNEVKQQIQQQVNIAQNNTSNQSPADEKKQIGKAVVSSSAQIKVPGPAGSQAQVVTQQKPHPNKISNITGLSSIPRISDVKKPKLESKPHNNRTSIDNDSDLYENNRTEPTLKKSGPQQQQPQLQNKSRQNSPITSVAKPSNQQHNLTPTKKLQQNSVTNNSRGKKRLFIALFDYDPFKMSPNTDSCQEELAFKEGEFIKVYGEQDADGYYYGESNGRSGYIPSNMVSEVQDQNVIRQVESNSGHGGSIESLTEPRSQKGASRNNLNSTNNNQNAYGSLNKSASKTIKNTSNNNLTGQSTSKNNAKEQSSFMPINNTNSSQYQQSKQANVSKVKMVALYDYDPQSLSPNVDLDVELPFNTGDIITVLGEMDEDGFFMAELNGKRGLVPSNFLQPYEN